MQIEAARSHAHQYVGVSMCEAVVAGTGTLFVNKHNRLAMRDLCELYLNDSVIQVAGDLLKVISGYCEVTGHDAAYSDVIVLDLVMS